MVTFGPWRGPLRCVVFDVDDTLYLERDYVRSGFRAVEAHLVAHHGVCGFFERAWRAFERGVRGHTFDEVLPVLGLDPTPRLVEELVAVYRGHAPAIALLPDARAALDAARGAGLAVAVVTDGPEPSQAAKVDALGLTRWADPIVLTARLGTGFGKPHPRAFELVEEESGCRGAACLYVADNPAKDFAGPKRLGWRTLRIRRPQGLHAAVRSGEDVDEEADSLAPLASSLRAADLPVAGRASGGAEGSGVLVKGKADGAEPGRGTT